ncbi:MAG TPA: hypothetical protein VMF60_01170 [Acidimicrobiales bacterium]|nr:hypothetical protein [Acidimicrobiales bacterium]
MRRVLPLVVLAMVLGATSCGSSPSPTAAPRTATTVPRPAGPSPAEIAKMPCQRKVQGELAEVLGVKAVVEPPTWVDHLYSCRYRYPDGSMQLSIKELSSWAQTYAYYDGLGRQLGDVGKLQNLGQGAFNTGNGSVVVRKDWKVLLVDITGLPAQFGVPPTSRGDIADTVADVILGCWEGD